MIVRKVQGFNEALRHGPITSGAWEAVSTQINEMELRWSAKLGRESRCRKVVESQRELAIDSKERVIGIVACEV